MNLKKSLFTIAFINNTAALVLSAAAFWGCMNLSSLIAPQGFIIDVHSSPITMIKIPEPAENAIKIAEIFSFLQIALPVSIYTLALFSTASMFYRLKLKEPLKILSMGTSRMIENDLDFMIETHSQDEMGQLCTAFETMRKALLENNRELWRQAEERKRLNAAFSHNLRNPVTVLKGSAKLAKQAILDGTVDTGQFFEHLSLIESYTDRIEHYIESMSSIQRIEEIPLVREITDWNSIILELEKMVHFFETDKLINFETDPYFHSILIDKSILFQIAENFMSNALRFAKQSVSISCTMTEDMFKLTVTDDGCGFPISLIKNGIQPFQKGSGDSEHFGMGLYTSKLLAERHSGSITIQNTQTGTIVSAALKVR